MDDNTITWNYSDLVPMAQRYFVLEVLPASVEFIGDTAFNYAQVDVWDENFEVIFTKETAQSYVVECAYDPNDKTEHNGWHEEGFILPDGQLAYAIRFQNTGNAPATDVRIEDQLSGLLQWNTLQPVCRIA